MTPACSFRASRRPEPARKDWSSRHLHCRANPRHIGAGIRVFAQSKCAVACWLTRFAWQPFPTVGVLPVRRPSVVAHDPRSRPPSLLISTPRLPRSIMEHGPFRLRWWRPFPDSRAVLVAAGNVSICLPHASRFVAAVAPRNVRASRAGHCVHCRCILLRFPALPRFRLPRPSLVTFVFKPEVKN